MFEITAEYLRSQGLSETFPERFWKKVDKNGPVPQHRPDLGPCWNFTGANNRHGYGKIGCGSASAGTIRSNRAAWLLAFGTIPVGLFVCHHCDNRKCVNPSHLFLGDGFDNMRDAKEKGRVSRIPNYGHATIDWDKANQIRVLHSTGTPDRAIAPMFGISICAVRDVIHNRTWVHDILVIRR